MKITKQQLLLSILSIAITLVSLAVMLCDFLIPLNFWTHPVLNFFFCLFIGLGGLTFVLGISKRLPWYFFLSSILFGLSIFYATFQYVPWWASFIIVLALWITVGVVSFIMAGNKTEEIALNKSPKYKNYEQRKAEKLQAEAEKEPEEMPEIKSFK